MEGIAEVVAALRASHEEGDLYRGQSREYPALLPSAYRKGVASGTEQDEMVRVNPRALFET